MRFPLRYDATTSYADFVRLLPLATAETGFSIQDGVFHGQNWQIRLTPLPALAIGLFRLERHRVEIAFNGLTEAQQDQFMQRFTNYYQRGGG